MTFSIKKVVPVLLLGGVAGFLGGLLGAGGGIPLVMGLHALFGKKTTNGRSFYSTALAVMLPLSVFSALQYAKTIPFSTDFFIYMAPAAMLGGAAGALLLSQLSTPLLGRIFATVVLLSGIFMVI